MKNQISLATFFRVRTLKIMSNFLFGTTYAVPKLRKADSPRGGARRIVK